MQLPIGVVPSVLSFVIRKKIPESPRWLEAQGRDAEAEALMQTIEKEAAGSGALPVKIKKAPNIYRTHENSLIIALPAIIIIERIISAPTTPRKRIRCWYFLGIPNVTKRSPQTKTLSTAKVFSIEYPLKY